MHHLEAENLALHRELGDIRKEGALKITPELASQTYTLRRITLGRGTGGWDEGRRPGDKGLRLVVEPRDADNHVIKTPGDLHVGALEISPEGVKTPLCSWDLDARALRGRWQAGFFSTGYIVILPWKKWPTTDRLRVVAQFRLADGRLFEAERDLTIRLPPPAGRGPLPAPPPEEGPALPPPVEELPSPRPLMSESRRYGRGPEEAPPPSPTAGIQPAACWQPAAPEPDAVQFGRPVPLPAEPKTP